MSEPVLYYIIIGTAAGTLGSLVGLGGGIIMVPALTILLGVDIKYAISASLISLVATSVMSVSVFAKKKLVHFKLGLLLETTTIAGSFAGSYIGVYLNAEVLMVLFAIVLIAASAMLIRNLYKKNNGPALTYVAPSAAEAFLEVRGSYTPEGAGTAYEYEVKKVPLNIVLSTFAGGISGLLGVGGGIFKVPMMHLIGGVPVKVATATSSFMIGFTGLAGAIVYFIYDRFDPVMTASLIFGIIGGSYIGSKIAMRVPAKALVVTLLIVLLYTSFRMMVKVIGIS